MKAHKVKCQICAPGIIVVTYRQPGDDSTGVMLVSANLAPAEAVDLASHHIAILKTAEAEKAGMNIAFTPEQIKATHEWTTNTTNILSHL